MAEPLTSLEPNREVLQRFSHPVSQCLAAPGREWREVCESKDIHPRNPLYPGNPSLLASAWMQEVPQSSPGGRWQRWGVDGQFVQPLPREPWVFRSVLHEHGVQGPRKGSGRARGVAHEPQDASEILGECVCNPGINAPGPVLQRCPVPPGMSRSSSTLLYLRWSRQRVGILLQGDPRLLKKSPNAGSEHALLFLSGINISHGEILCWWRAKAALCLCVMLRWHPWLFRCDSPGDGKVEPGGWKGSAWEVWRAALLQQWVVVGRREHPGSAIPRLPVPCLQSPAQPCRQVSKCSHRVRMRGGSRGGGLHLQPAIGKSLLWD